MSPYSNYDYGSDYANHIPPKKIPIIRFVLMGLFLFFIIQKLSSSPTDQPSDQSIVANKELKEVPVLVASADIKPKAAAILPDTIHKKKNVPSISESIPPKRTASDLDMEDYFILQKDSALAEMIRVRLKRHKPDGAFILLVDGKSNEVLAWGQRNDSALSLTPDFLTRATFPAASLSKIVTAAAGLESKKYTNGTLVPQIGRTVTLYRRQLNPPKNYRGHKVSVEKAFSLSMNPAFGIIGKTVGPSHLKDAAKRLGFNQNYSNNIPQRSAFLQIDSGYAVAEAASGFTELNTISPLQAAGIARSILYSKPFELPWSRELAGYIHHRPIRIKSKPFSENTYWGLRKMFNKTTKGGTATRAMRKHVYRSNQKKYITGGKTGSLDGSNPKGRYDWFVGWAYNKDDINDAVIMVVMQYHGKYRSLRSSDMAGLMVNYWERYVSRTKDFEVAQK